MTNHFAFAYRGAAQSLLLILLLFAWLVPFAAAEEKKQPPGAELTSEESRQVDRLGDLYAEVGQQLAEAHARVKVLTEMQQKLMSDFQTFQTAALAARGYKPGQAALDMQQRKVTPIPVKPAEAAQNR